MDVNLNMKTLNIEVIIFIYQQKDTVSLNVSISKQVKITNNNILILSEMKKEGQTLGLKLEFNHFVEQIIII